MSALRRKPELLAPAGSREAFAAALLAGADAVYLGLGDFNARRNADNFTLEELAWACDKAHLAGRRIYLTANTLVLDAELTSALELVHDAWEAGVDAVIVQDLGFMSAIASAYPEIELHASTQLNVLNRAGVETLASLGVTRVTLGREASLAEISLLADAGIDLEVFAHGALCICHSGQCLMSSLIGRRSANRGLCAQPCRLPWELVDASTGQACELDPETGGEHLLSPKDLCTIDILPQMIRAGIASLKIEGRMKSADYVATVVRTYRAALDRAFADPNGYEALPAEKAALQEAFSRGFSTAYLEGERGNAMMSYRRPNNRGVLIGRIASVHDGLIDIVCARGLQTGDILEVWTGRGRETVTVDRIIDENACEVISCAAQDRVSIPCAGRVGIGDRVFRVRSSALSAQADALTEGFSGVPAALDFSVSVRLGEPLRVTVTDCQGRVASAEGAICEVARTKAVTREQIEEHVGRLGGTPYEVASWDIDLDEGVGLGFSSLHRVRKEALEAYEEMVLAPWHERILPTASAEVLPTPDDKPVSHAKGNHAAEPDVELAVIVASEQDADIARRTGADVIYANTFDLVRNAGFADVAILPTVLHDAELDRHLEVAGQVGRAVADSISLIHVTRARGIDVESGPRVNVLNGNSAKVLERMSVERLWLSPELSLAQIASILGETHLPATLTVLGAQEIMVTEHCELMALGPCGQKCETCPRRTRDFALRDRKGYLFPVRTDDAGRGHVYNAVQLDLATAVPDLVRAGVSRFVVDGTLLDADELASATARIRDALDAARFGRPPLAKREGTTSGHLFRGVL